MVNRAKRIHHPRILLASMRPPRLRLKLCPGNNCGIPTRRRPCRHFGRRHAPAAQTHQSHRAPPAAAPTLHPTMDTTAPQETHTLLSVGSQPHPTPCESAKGTPANTLTFPFQTTPTRSPPPLLSLLPLPSPLLLPLPLPVFRRHPERSEGPPHWLLLLLLPLHFFLSFHLEICFFLTVALAFLSVIPSAARNLLPARSAPVLPD
jgi:hypothetical protein